MKPQSQKKKLLVEESVEAKTQPSYTFKDGVKDATKIKDDLVKGLWDQLFLDSARAVPDQLLGWGPSKRSGDLQEGQAVSLKAQASQEQREKKAVLKASAHQEYFRAIEVRDKPSHEEQATNHRKIQEILIELKKLTATSSELKAQFKEVTVEEMPVNPGTYHVNFFEWMLAVVRSARRNLESGRNWLAMFASKKRQKKYWGMAKKHGTTFMLSGERTTATQTG